MGANGGHTSALGVTVGGGGGGGSRNAGYPHPSPIPSNQILVLPETPKGPAPSDTGSGGGGDKDGSSPSGRGAVEYYSGGANNLTQVPQVEVGGGFTEVGEDAAASPGGLVKGGDGDVSLTIPGSPITVWWRWWSRTAYNHILEWVEQVVKSCGRNPSIW